MLICVAHARVRAFVGVSAWRVHVCVRACMRQCQYAAARVRVVSVSVWCAREERVGLGRTVGAAVGSIGRAGPCHSVHAPVGVDHQTLSQSVRPPPPP